MQEQLDKPDIDSDFEPTPALEDKSRIRRILAWRPTWPRMSEKVRNLNISQWIYLVAILVLIVNLEDGELGKEGLNAVGLVASLGLLRELWFLFHSLWQKTLGKGLILVLYAATANFALAVSALKINMVAGVEPSSFVFTLAFATLLMLPFWLLVASIVFFSTAIVAINLWLLFSLLVRVVGIKLKVHWEDKSFVLLTMILRLILIPLVIGMFVQILEPYAEQIRVMETPAITVFNPDDFTEEELAQIREVPLGSKRTAFIEELIEKKAAKTGEIAQVVRVGVTGTLEPEEADAEPSGAESLDEATPDGEAATGAEEEDAEDEEADTRFLDQSIATFIYWFETYPYSACEKKPEQRTLILDENVVLVVEEDDSDIGYKFSVMTCEPRALPHTPNE